MEQFKNRIEAGILLANKLSKMSFNKENTVILGIPRGGVPVAYEVSKALKLPLEIILVKKIGSPGYSELAVGSVSEDNEIFLNHQLINELGLRTSDIDSIKEKAIIKLKNIGSTLRSGRSSIDLKNKNVIIVDDGIATGATMEVVIQVLRKRMVKHITIATPVSSADTIERLYKEVDDFVVLKTPHPFFAVGEWYQDFSQVETDEVIKILKEYSNKKTNDQHSQSLL